MIVKDVSRRSREDESKFKESRETDKQLKKKERKRCLVVYIMHD